MERHGSDGRFFNSLGIFRRVKMLMNTLSNQYRRLMGNRMRTLSRTRLYNFLESVTYVGFLYVTHVLFLTLGYGKAYGNGNVFKVERGLGLEKNGSCGGVGFAVANGKKNSRVAEVFRGFFR